MRDLKAIRRQTAHSYREARKTGKPRQVFVGSVSGLKIAIFRKGDVQYSDKTYFQALT